jgi:hypothetical protein
MRGFVGWLNHRDAVFANLNALLLLYPPRRQFTDDFPKLKSIVRAHFDDGVSANLSALRIAETILQNFIRQLEESEKARVLGALIATGREGFAEIAERRVQGAREPLSDNVTFVTHLAGVAIFMAGRLADEGTIGRHDFEGFVERQAAALGADAETVKALKNGFEAG